jgi:hypothetical protein
MSPRPSLIVALALGAVAAGCAHRATPSLAPTTSGDAVDTARGVAVNAVGEYVGWYRWAFEHSEFVACGVAANDRPWWVIPTADALRQRDSLAAIVVPDREGGEPVFVRVRGIAGGRVATGAGHLGASTRYFRLLEVLEMRKADGATCPART